jgi:DNA adenine methylase
MKPTTNFIKCPLRYMGSKGLLAPEIIKRIPEHVCYVEPFSGSARVFFRKEPSKVEILNDLDGELVNFWRVVQNHPQEFARCFDLSVISRQVFEWEQTKTLETLTDIQRAARYFYLQQLCYAGRTDRRTLGTTSFRPPYLNLPDLDKKVRAVHQRLQRVMIERLDASECIRIYDHSHTFFYVDPPYLDASGYQVGFTRDDLVRMRDQLRTIQGRFIVSLNDSEEVRALFQGFVFEEVQTTYYIANARKTLSERKKTRRELLIHNLRRDDPILPCEREPSDLPLP